MSAPSTRNGVPTLVQAPARWTPAQVEAIDLASVNVAPVIGEDDFVRISPDIDIWDAWPIQRDDGHPAIIGDGVTLWMALAAPHFSNPDERHGHARIHLFERRESRWRHLGPVMPDGFSPGSREWSGSAVLKTDGESLTLYFTATGKRGEAIVTFDQRLFKAQAALRQDAAGASLSGWYGLEEIVQRDPAHYMATDAASGSPGTIKAFRDPAFFRDPKDGRCYVCFAASQAGSTSSFNGVVGWASEQAAGSWKLLPPLIGADGLNNELERPHVVYHGDLYYLFWSTQRHVFDPAGPTGPTGLYGMVSDRLTGNWQPLNGTGLVFANPPEAPSQAYSWLVLPDLSVTSFVDDWRPDAHSGTRRFGATFAPDLHLALEGVAAMLRN